MKRNFEKYLMNYIAEGMTEGLGAADKKLTLLSMNLSNQTSNQVMDEMTGLGAMIRAIELEEEELLECSRVIINALLQSLTPGALKQMHLLSYERSKAVIGTAAAKKLLVHDRKVTRKLMSNLKKMLENSKFRIAVAEKCHLKVVK